MFKNLDEMKAHVHGKVKATVVIAGAHTESVLDAAILAKQEGLADSLLVGNKQQILALLQKMYLQFHSVLGGCLPRGSGLGEFHEACQPCLGVYHALTRGPPARQCPEKHPFPF